jgi:hypothetical protein
VTGHPSQDELADHLADPSASVADAAGVRAHLQTCAQCRQRLDRLARDFADVTRVLAAEPAERMPDDVFASISGALRDEQAARDERAQTSVTAAPVDLGPARERRRRARLHVPVRLLAAAAAVVVAAGVGVSVLLHGGVGPSGSGSNAASTMAGANQTGPANTGNSSAGSSNASPTVLHKASFARDVRALLAASPAPTSTGAGRNNGNDNDNDNDNGKGNNGPGRSTLNRPGIGSLATGPATCTLNVLAGTRFAHQDLSIARAVTVDGIRAQLVIATDGAGRRTAIAVTGCGGEHPHVLAKAVL